MVSAARLISQLAAYALFGVLLARFSASPAYQYAEAEFATIKLSLSHAADRAKPCIRLTPEQVAELAPNMRQLEQCERERLPLVVELEIDGSVVAHVVAPPSGVWNDGAASVYERLEVKAGEHLLIARLRDSNRYAAWDYEHSERAMLQSGRYFTITFDAATGGFRFR